MLQLLLECDRSLSILKPKAMDHVIAENAERITGMATPSSNRFVQTIVAIT